MSTSDPTSAVVREVLRAHVDSFEKLELLAALHRTVLRSASLGDLTKALQLPPVVVQGLAGDLERAGIIERTNDPVGHVRMSPISPLRAVVDELLATYATDRIAVVTALSQVSMEKIRGMAARAFADAFVVRKPKGEGDG